MTITLLDLYNSAASQEWSMYDNDAASNDEMENSLILSINKAVQEILYSYPFNFREKTHVLITIPNINSYQIPSGLIKKNSNNEFCVFINSKPLNYLKDLPDNSEGIPNSFCIKNNNIILYPSPKEKCIITIEYITTAIGEDKDGNDIFTLKNDTDTITLPSHLEEIFKNAVIARTMLNSIASETDENYSAYKKQSEKAYRLLIKYSKGVGQDKSVVF